jgi:chromosome partitioning protein
LNKLINSASGIPEKGIMATISIASAKGGCAKTTLALLLSAELALSHGYRVALLDSDLNQHASLFGNKAKISGLTIIGSIDEDNVLKTLRDAEKTDDAVVVDLAGGSSTLALMALQRSHLILVPTQVSLPDSRDAMKTIAQINNAQELARTPIAHAIVWTRVTAQFESRENRHIRTSMEAKGVDILSTALMERNAFRSIHITGKVPRQSAPKSPAAENIAQITKEVLTRLERLSEAA